MASGFTWMVERHGHPWSYLALGLLAVLVLVIGWTALNSGPTSEAVIRQAAEAAPDLRPKLPDLPKLPDAPIPVPK